MSIRLAAACLASFFLVACDDNGKDQSRQKEANICKGISESECATKSECQWDAGKAKCRRKKTELRPEAKPSPNTDQSPSTETAPPHSQAVRGRRQTAGQWHSSRDAAVHSQACDFERSFANPAESRCSWRSTGTQAARQHRKGQRSH